MLRFEITLSFIGNNSDFQEIDFYELSQALVGFDRSLALTTHLVLNGEIITQAPALKGAKIVALPPSEGSWKLSAAVLAVAAGAYQLGTAPKDTPIGHLVRSAYDYVVSESLGFHVDFEKTLGQQYDDLKKSKTPVKELTQSKFDSLIEKCENSIKDMHRPLVKSETAEKAILSSNVGRNVIQIGKPFTKETFEYIAYTERSSNTPNFVGKVTSYNVNTFKGRIYVAAEGRPIPFELADTSRNFRSIAAITASLTANAHSRMAGNAEIEFTAYRNHSSTGRLKYLYITQIH